MQNVVRILILGLMDTIFSDQQIISQYQNINDKLNKLILIEERRAQMEEEMLALHKYELGVEVSVRLLTYVDLFYIVNMLLCSS